MTASWPPSQTSPASQSSGTIRPRRFVGRNSGSTSTGNNGASSSRPAPTSVNNIPSEILEDSLLNTAVEALLPANYSFEVHKTIWHVRRYKIERVALQMPEGLAMFATSLADIIERFTTAEAVILADVTYGACCVDDYTARALGCDMLVHYGHSCLIPIDTTAIRCLYVFVEIGVDSKHLLDTVRLNFPACLLTPSTSSSPTRNGKPALSVAIDLPSAEESVPPESTFRDCHIAVVGTVQFLSAVHCLKSDLEDPSLHDKPLYTRLALPSSTTQLPSQSSSPPIHVRWRVTVPQVKPLSPGEILGCTAPRLPKDVDALLYVGDGRFHLESIMIANPAVPAYRYDPYEKRLTKEGYDHAEMRKMRNDAIVNAKKSLTTANHTRVRNAVSENLAQSASLPVDIDAGKAWAVVLGTLGRQGSQSVLSSVLSHLPVTSAIPVLLSELSPAKLARLGPDIAAYVQTSCPRLSIDWGYAFDKPLLSPYEASVALGRVASKWAIDVTGENGQTAQKEYPMDFYADESLGNWTPRWHVGQNEKQRRDRRAARGIERDQAKNAAVPSSLNAKSLPVY